MKHEGREDVQRNEGIYIFHVLHILHAFVFKMLFLNMHKACYRFLMVSEFISFQLKRLNHKDTMLQCSTQKSM